VIAHEYEVETSYLSPADFLPYVLNELIPIFSMSCNETRGLKQEDGRVGILKIVNKLQ
jgi:hypothetical protein